MTVVIWGTPREIKRQREREIGGEVNRLRIKQHEQTGKGNGKILTEIEKINRDSRKKHIQRERHEEKHMEKNEHRSCRQINGKTASEKQAKK